MDKHATMPRRLVLGGDTIRDVKVALAERAAQRPNQHFQEFVVVGRDSLWVDKHSRCWLDIDAVILARAVEGEPRPDIVGVTMHSDENVEVGVPHKAEPWPRRFLPKEKFEAGEFLPVTKVQLA